MKLLITGGCGFIGSNFIRHILKKYPDYKIINLDKLTYAGNKENLRSIEKNKNYKLIKGDICNYNLVDKLMKKADVVIHFAAESHVDNSIKDSSIFVQTNVLGTETLLRAARKNKIKRFIHVSTDEVYGSIKKGKFTETSDLSPNSPYSASKAASDLLVNSYIKTYTFPAIITRSSNNYGPFQYPEKFIPLAITNVLEEKKIPVYGAGNNIRDWIHVQDNCEAIDFVFHNGLLGETYNIGGGNEKTNNEIAKLLLNSLSKDDSSIQYVKDRLGHDYKYALDITKIKKLGWKPRINFEKGLKNTIDWYKYNTKWWKRLKK